MRPISLAVLISLTSLSAAAREYKFKKQVDPGVLQKQLMDAGFAVQYVACSRDDCKIVLANGEKKNPKTIVDSYKYVDPRLEMNVKRQRLVALYGKLIDRSITQDERDETMRIVIEHLRLELLPTDR